MPRVRDTLDKIGVGGLIAVEGEAQGMRLQATRRYHGRRASRFKGGLPGSAVEAGAWTPAWLC